MTVEPWREEDAADPEPVAVDFDAVESDNLESLSNNGRHASLYILCTLLHGVIVASAAEAILDEGVDALPAVGGIWVAPSFGWLVPRIDVGRKDRGPNGTRLRLPVRLEWPHVIEVIPASAAKRPETFSWVTTSMGHSGAGATQVSLSPGYGAWESVESEAGIPVQAHGPLLDRDEMWEALKRIRDEGNAARWEFILGLEKRVLTALNRAHASLSREVAVYTGVEAPLFDKTKIEKVRDRFMFGEAGHPGKIAQILNRLVDPVTLNKVDPWRYIEAALRRDAKEALRQEIGDPRIGAKVREFQRELQCPDIPTLVEEFRKMYPKSHLSDERAISALNVGPDLMAQVWSIHDDDEPDYFADSDPDDPDAHPETGGLDLFDEDPER